jgi:hypothetical protein
VDLFIRFNQSNSSSFQESILAPFGETISKISVLAECHQQRSVQPWYVKLYNHRSGTDTARSLYDRATESSAAWMEIFTKGFDKGFVTSPELGDPSDGNFIHNVHATQNRKENVDKLCLAETNLNIFWTYVDDNLSRLATDWQKGAFRRVLEEGGPMRRTTP